MAMQVASTDFDSRQVEIMRRTVAAGTSPEDFALFLEVCKHRGLNPFAREIYAIVRGNKMTIQVSIDGFRKLAERSGKYRGQKGPYFCDESGEWKEEWLQKKPPVAAKVGILRSDFDEPMWAIARYDAYVQESSPLWKKMPDVLLAKCAEALGLRKTFPDEMSGLYVHEEMAQAGKMDKPLPVVSTEPTEIVEAEIVSEKHENGHQNAQTSHPSNNGKAVSVPPQREEAEVARPAPEKPAEPKLLTLGQLRTQAYKLGYKDQKQFEMKVAEVFGRKVSQEELIESVNLAKLRGALQKEEEKQKATTGAGGGR